MEPTKTLSQQVAGAMNRETGTRLQQPQGLYPKKMAGRETASTANRRSASHAGSDGSALGWVLLK